MMNSRNVFRCFYMEKFHNKFHSTSTASLTMFITEVKSKSHIDNLLIFCDSRTNLRATFVTSKRTGVVHWIAYPSNVFVCFALLMLFFVVFFVFCWGLGGWVSDHQRYISLCSPRNPPIILVSIQILQNYHFLIMTGSFVTSDSAEALFSICVHISAYLKKRKHNCRWS